MLICRYSYLFTVYSVKPKFTTPQCLSNRTLAEANYVLLLCNVLLTTGAWSTYWQHGCINDGCWSMHSPKLYLLAALKKWYKQFMMYHSGGSRVGGFKGFQCNPSHPFWRNLGVYPHPNFVSWKRHWWVSSKRYPIGTVDKRKQEGSSSCIKG